MTDLFLQLLNMSIAASWLVLAVVLIRFIFKNMPKWIICILWGLLALRLIFPVHFQSPLSLIPSPEVIPQDITVSQTPAIYSGIPAINSAVNPLFQENLPEAGFTLETVIDWGSKIWLIGAAVLLLYSVVSYFKLYRLVRVSLHHKDNVYICDDVESPFLLGFIRPRIYIPSGMDEESTEYVLLHENAHIKRRDHWWKPLGFLLLCVYWYNPLIWLAYCLLCRDIERACDEKVIVKMDNTGKANYSAVLAACSIHPRMITACPVAFGEIDVKTRIKGVLLYKKPALWIILISVLICLFTAVCFLTDPLPCLHNYTGEITTEATCTHQGVSMLTCTNCQHCYAVPVDTVAHSYEHSAMLTSPTCTQYGTELLVCTVCGGQETVTVEKNEHIANGQVYVINPTCSEQGEISTACSVCNTICSTEILPANGVHDMHETVLREATCELPGEGIISCSGCGYSESCTYEQTEHHYLNTVYTEPTCVSTGAMRTECTLCGSYFDTLLDPTGYHSWVYMNSKYENCTHCGLRRSTNSFLLDGVVGSTSSDPYIPTIRIFP